MSHYRIAVFSGDGNYRRLLEPYSEEDEEYYVFEPLSQEELDKKWEKFSAQNPNWTRDLWLKEMFRFNKETGQYGYWYNPKAGYDYYFEVDLKEYLDLKPQHSFVNDEDDGGGYMKSMVDFMKEPGVTKERAAKEWREYSDHGDGWYNEKYYLERYGSEEQYVTERLRPWMPYAFVTPDGVWHAPGKVGWFAVSDETAESMNRYWEEWKDFIEHGENCHVHIIDCHI